MAEAATSPRAELYVVLFNTSGRQNLGTYLRTASAFGATQVIVVGSDRFGTHGAHRAQKYVDIVHFYHLAEAHAYLKSKGCAIVGVKSTEGSRAAHVMPYTGSTAFLIENEDGCIMSEHAALCDGFVHVPFHGPQKTPLVMDTTVIAAIVLHHFTKWAGFIPRAFEATSTQGKFVLDAYPTFDPNDTKALQVTAAREAKRAMHAAEEASEELVNIFG